jgi:hypothetical protein
MQNLENLALLENLPLDADNLKVEKTTVSALKVAMVGMAVMGGMAVTVVAPPFTSSNLPN